MSDEEVCGVCSSTKPEHATMNHEFSIEGILIPKKKTEPRRPRVQVVPDLVLREAMIATGLLTAQNLNDAEGRLRERLSRNADS